MYAQQLPVMMSYGAPYGYPAAGQPMVMTQHRAPVALLQQQQLPQQQLPPQQQQRPTYSEQDFKTVKDMFPNMDDEIINSVLLSSGGNVDTAVNHLLGMTG